MASLVNYKVSFFFYPYKILEPFIYFGNLKIASIADIGCMKAVAISQRAEKKDFFDLMEILHRVSSQPIESNVSGKIR